MNDVINCIMERRSIRRYKPEQIKADELKQILEAGLYAANAGSRQSSFVVVCQNADIICELGQVKSAAFKGRYSDGERYVSKEQPSIADDPNIKNAYYDAPTVITIFTPKDFLFGAYDGSCMATNMSLAAWSLGIGSCFIGAAWEAFACELGQRLLVEWNIPGNYHADIQLCLGYPLDSTPPKAKPRKDGRIVYAYQMGAGGHHQMETMKTLVMRVQQETIAKSK
ncbi:MAG: nitroreductase family protein [Clostridiales bacterium]|nr:nitroreductase family protein [Clostridiales bacterium]